MRVSARSRKSPLLTIRAGGGHNCQRPRAEVCSGERILPALALRVNRPPKMLSDHQPILIIDDNVNLAKGFALVLQRSGYRVNVAHTAEEGLRLAQADNPAAVIVDFRMPFINGAGFLYRLRACPKQANTPVLVVTAAAVNDEMRAQLAELRAELRFKPLGVEDLLAEVGALVGEPVRPRGAMDPGQIASRA
jgi:CheY-like chemotaxis protein